MSDEASKRPKKAADGASCQHGDHAAPHTPARLASEEAVEAAARLFRAVGDPARLRLLERLSGGEWCVSELAEVSGAGLSTVSQQLRVLRAERLVTRRRQGKHIFYALTDAHVADLVKSALSHASEADAPRNRDDDGDE